jgi:hypothetical protein
MPDLAFAIDRVQAPTGVAAPAIEVMLRVVNRSGEPVDAVMLRCQVQIECARRRYSAAEKERLLELFGDPGRWGQTLGPLLWANLSVNLPAFTGESEYPLQLPCTFDFNVAATKYFYGIEAGEIPATAMFSGTVFYRTAAGLQAQPIPWDREARFVLPGRLWRDAMEAWYPGQALLHVSRATLDAVQHFRVEHGLATLDQAVVELLRGARHKAEVA